MLQDGTYTYDANGNQTGRGTDTFTFDHEDRMTQSVAGGVTSSSVYYGNGVRRSHTVNGATTSYQYDVLASLPVVIQDGTYSYVYGLDLISMTDGAGTQHYFSYDGLGSLSDLTGGTGAVTDTFAYDVFGAVTTRTGTTPNAWKFTGEQADDGTGDSGYYFLRARYYDTATGRFIGRDRLEFEQRYAYAGNNPILYADPSGLCRRSLNPLDWGDCALDAADVTRDGARFALNAPVTALAYAWAERHGGDCSLDGNLFVICAITRGADPRGGITLGNVYSTGLDRLDIDQDLYGHESQHATDSASFPGYYAIYGANEAIVRGLQWAFGWPLGDSACYNFFEWRAGRKEGGYQC